MIEEELLRYQRQIILQDWGVDTQNKLKEKKVFVAGAGGAASVILTLLTLVGVGKITMCDEDVVEESNGNRQFIHFINSESRIGEKKVISAQKTLSYLNPFVDFQAIEEKIREDNVDQLIDGYDAVFAAVDSFSTMFVLSRACVKKGIPLFVDGQLDINSFAAMCYPPKGFCFHCIFDEDRVEVAEYFAKKRKDKFVVSSCAPSIFLGASHNVLGSLKVMLDIAPPDYSKLFLFLQKGQKINESKDFNAFLFWFNKHLINELHRDNYFIENEAFRGKVIEELYIKRNPKCPVCGNIH